MKNSSRDIRATVVGLGGAGHEWASCAMQEGCTVAIAEERVTRLKYGLGADLIAAKSRGTVLGALGSNSEVVESFVACDLVPKSFRFGVRRRLETINHHLAHAWSVFSMSGYKDAAILVVDNSGSITSGEMIGRSRGVETASIFDASSEGIRLVERVEGEQVLDVKTESDYYEAGTTTNSLGHFYRATSIALGHFFKHPRGEGIFSEDGKTMGLAAYGDERYTDMAADLLVLDRNGFSCDPQKLDTFLARALKSGSFSERAAVASAVQKLLEEALLHLAFLARRRTGRVNLCLAGGVALNSAANGVVARKSPFQSVYVSSAPGDDGIALGCAAYGLWTKYGLRPVKSRDAYLGPEPDGTVINTCVERSGLKAERPDDIVEATAHCIARGEIVGWYQGRSEFGPRALGHRSILAPVHPSWVRGKLNHEVKNREWFRPYAPMVPEEYKEEYFSFPGTSPHMSFVAPVLKPGAMPAALHVDNTARLQTVSEMDNPEIHALLGRVGELTGVPVVLNTSFNNAGDPIVETPEEAMRCAVKMKLDRLVLDRWMVSI